MTYDIGIIGGGPGGYTAAIRASQLGGRILLIEKENMGGVCLNKGCIPTKSLLNCSHLYKSICKASEYGINTESPTFDFEKMMEKKEKVVKMLVNGVGSLMKSNNITVVKGTGLITDRNHIKVGNDIYEVKNIIIATGSVPSRPKIKGIDSNSVISSDEFLSMKKFPSSMIIIGGGIIGVEFGFLLSELGCKVTILEMMENILCRADSEIIEEVAAILQRNGIEIITSARICAINGNQVEYEKNGTKNNIEAEKILISSGRIPNVNIEELNMLGIKHTNGMIETNMKMQTNIPGIFAIGDVNGKYMLAHVASSEGIVAAENIFNIDSKMNYKNIAQCLYIYPEVAWIGITEEEAIHKGMDIVTGKFPVYANGKSLIEGERYGFIKFVADRKHNEILGVHMLCTRATDLIAEAALAINLEAATEDIGKTIHPHPTISEAIMEAANIISNKAINI